ncbi:MAG: hypothetical protein OXP66_01950 [Candidatus Tectomicrobia bacterium]|nr:hypothetical protein [Candidatus Tectomicrobia bacterium]
MPNWLSGITDWAKGHRVQTLCIALGLLAMGWYLFLSGEDAQEVQRQHEEEMFGAGAVPGDATTAKALTEMQVAVENLGFALSRQQEKHDRLMRDVQTQATQFGARLDDQERSYTEQLEAALEAAIALARETERREADRQAPPVASPPRLRILRPDGGKAPPPSPAAAPEPAQPAGGAWVRLPVGSLVTGELLTGAFATKVRGDALPVLVQLRSAYSGPNDSEIPLEGCLMIGKATADLQSVRARVEAVSLSCVLPDGTSFERAVKGYFTGEDGTLGVPGRWEFRSGRWLANLLSAMGTTAAGVYADVAIARELGAAGAILGDVGTSQTTTRVQEFFLQRAEEILPVVWVESRTPVYVVMLEGLTIEGLPADWGWPSLASDWD